MAAQVNSFQMRRATDVLSFLDFGKQSPALTHFSFITSVPDFHSLKYNEGMSSFEQTLRTSFGPELGNWTAVP